MNVNREAVLTSLLSADGGLRFDSNLHSNDISAFLDDEKDAASASGSKGPSRAGAAHMLARAGTNITLACPGVAPTT